MEPWERQAWRQWGHLRPGFPSMARLGAWVWGPGPPHETGLSASLPNTGVGGGSWPLRGLPQPLRRPSPRSHCPLFFSLAACCVPGQSDDEDAGHDGDDSD